MPSTTASRDYSSADPLHIHIENSRAMMPVFTVHTDQYEAALGRHPDVAARIRTTWGHDQDIYHDAMETADAMITYRFPHKTLRDDGKRLKLLQVLGAGVDYLLPLDWVPSGLQVLTNSGAHLPKAAQSGLMALLMLNARMPALMWNHRRHAWDRQFTSALNGKTVLIVGVGAIGGGIATLAKQFGMHVMGIRRSGAPHESVDSMHLPGALRDLLPQADFVLLNTALTEETRFLIGAEEIARMRDGAGLINMSRGGLIDPAALDSALRTGKLGGAMIDVTYPEPPPADWPYWETPNLVITPHVLSDDIEHYIPHTLDIFFNNIRRHFHGEPLTNLVDLARSY
ncbi:MULTISPECIES: NAD(P)-dependent oxidoreductase [Cupriavidus]|uniref:D-2-hydroxyacid dehydrogenase n=1 Tax=Cupriavidus pauculus TaxID=82633 RepID=A0A5P2HG73_9BURK|nr:NAD(P)-dependent oxidoreductase [Cupriavidus pauculus]QET06070.1 D-2-hydroxyacid dehydrogenase [Cupriavidus pauculus]